MESAAVEILREMSEFVCGFFDWTPLLLTVPSYPLKSLVQCIRKLARTSVLWSKILGDVVQVKGMLGGDKAHKKMLEH